MKKTAVEWLIEQWPILESQIPERILEQAKEMEKQQMKIACIRTEYEDKAWQNLMEKQFEQYYNETFKKSER
jgi:uncharacterized metal-binding protein